MLSLSHIRTLLYLILQLYYIANHICNLTIIKGTLSKYFKHLTQNVVF